MCARVAAAWQVLHDIGEKHGVSASCVAGRWVLQQPGVSGIILGARNATHLRVRAKGGGGVSKGACSACVVAIGGAVLRGCTTLADASMNRCVQPYWCTPNCLNPSLPSQSAHSTNVAPTWLLRPLPRICCAVPCWRAGHAAAVQSWV